LVVKGIILSPVALKFWLYVPKNLRTAQHTNLITNSTIVPTLATKTENKRETPLKIDQPTFDKRFCFEAHNDLQLGSEYNTTASDYDQMLFPSCQEEEAGCECTTSEDGQQKTCQSPEEQAWLKAANPWYPMWSGISNASYAVGVFSSGWFFKTDDKKEMELKHTPLQQSHLNSYLLFTCDTRLHYFVCYVSLMVFKNSRHLGIHNFSKH
jgi:hypothetical protein